MKIFRMYLLFGFACALLIVSCKDSSTSADQEPNGVLKVTTNSITSITSNGAESGGNVTDEGGATVTARGVCWSISENPTISDNCTSDGSGTGSFTSSITNLNPTTQYYVRAYATNTQGTAYGKQLGFRTESLKDTVTAVVDVTNPATGRTWMDRNLGASRAATSSTDTEAYGDLYQWGRPADGHEKRDSPTTTELSSTHYPGHGSFILSSFAQNNDWRSQRNEQLWQGVNGINNPCPGGYRLPTFEEWQAEVQSWSGENAAGAFASPLKLPMAGYRLDHENGLIVEVGTRGRYWSTTASQDFTIDGVGAGTIGSANGLSVRCIRF